MPPQIYHLARSTRSTAIACGAVALILLGVSQIRGQSCGPSALLVLVIAGAVASVLFVRVPGPRVISVAPVLLLPTWLGCGWASGFAVALLASPVVYLFTRRAGASLPIDVALSLVALSAAGAGATIAEALASSLDASTGRVVVALGFMVGHAGGEWLARLTATHLGAGEPVRATPCSSLPVNLLLAIPGAILTGLLLERDVVVFGGVVVLLLAALALIGLYVGSESDRYESAGERARLRSIVDHAPDGIFAVDRDCSVEWLNDTAARQIGWDPGDALGRPCGEVVRLSTAGGTPVDHHEAFLRSAQTGLAIHTVGNVHSRDGRDVPVEITYTAMVDDDGHVEVGVGSVRETHAAGALEDRAATLGHELRSPLTSILGYAKLMQTRADSLDAPHRAEFVARIAESGDYMLRLVNNLLDLRRIESGAEELRFAALDLPAVLASALTMIQPRAAEKRIRLASDIGPGLGAFVTDELHLRRAVDNLLSNAVKYTRTGGEVRVVARGDRDGVEIAVADTGIGLTEEERSHLFERFFRSNRPEARDERGTGLGLVLVRETVRRLDGDVHVESTVGRGSTFTIRLPLRQLRTTVQGTGPIESHSSVA